MDDVDVQLRPLTEEGVAKLLETAVADADPLEVMVPVAGPPDGTPSGGGPSSSSTEPGRSVPTIRWGRRMSSSSMPELSERHGWNPPRTLSRPEYGSAARTAGAVLAKSS